MKNLSSSKLTHQEMTKIVGGTSSPSKPKSSDGGEFIRPNVEKPIFKQEFGQQNGNHR